MWAFRVDEEGDRAGASDGESRFGAYLRRGDSRFEWAGVDRALFAAAALEMALPPVMSPGYVLSHSRVRGVEMRQDGEGRLAYAVTLVSASPAGLERECGLRSGWARESAGFGGPVWAEPERCDRAVVLPLLVVLVPVRAEVLPVPRHLDEDERVPVVAVAKRAVRQMVGELNRVLVPVLEQLDVPVSSRRSA